MTKNYRDEDVKAQSLIAKAAEMFPSPPKKDGTPDPQNILAKKAQEKAEAWAKTGGKKGVKKDGSSSGTGNEDGKK